MADNEQDDQLSEELGAQFDRLATGQFPTADSDAPKPEHSAAELDAALAEMSTRLAMAEENLTAVTKERDAAREAHKKLERTLAEFLSRFASVRETQAAAFKEVNKLTETRRDLEAKVTALTAQLTAAQNERDAANKRHEELAAQAQQAAGELETMRQQLAQAQQAAGELDTVRQELAQLRETAVASLEPLGLEHHRSMTALMDQAAKLLAEAQQVRTEANHRLGNLEQVLGEFRGQVEAARQDVAQRLAVVLGGPGTEPANPPAPAAEPGSALDGHAV